MDGEERSKEKEEEKENGEVKEEDTREGVTKVDIVLDCESKKSDAKDVCRQQKATNQNDNIICSSPWPGAISFLQCTAGGRRSCE